MWWATTLPGMSDDYVRIGNPPAAPVRPSRKRWIPLAAAAVILVISAAGGLYFFVLSPSGTFDVTGTMRVHGTSFTPSTGGTCLGKGGFDDLRPGAQVVITDAASNTVGIGALGPGKLDPAGCTFAFKVEGVPGNHDFYGVEVTHRGRVQYDAATMRKPLALSIGR